MPNPATSNYSLQGFSGPDRICSQCAQDAHRAANRSTADYVTPNFDVKLLCVRIDPVQPMIYLGGCWACGELAHLLPAHGYGVPAPTKAAHKFAIAVLNVYLSGQVSTSKIRNVRARCEAGRYWVEFKPAGSVFIHTEAARNPTEAVARFMRASCGAQ